MNIFKSFEMFWSLPRKIFGNKFFNIQHVETDVQEETHSEISADISEENIYLTVYNSPKVYSLLTSVLYKKKMLNENKNSKIYNERSFN